MINLEEYLEAWSTETSLRQLAILGEYGQGKSTIALKFTYDQIARAQQGIGRIPILIELRGKSPGTLQPLELLGAWCATYRIDAKALMRLIISGRVLLIFDGFDEMANAAEVEARFSHFRSLWKFCYQKNKLLITGRPNLFLDDRELKAALGVADGSGGGSPYCEALYLRMFDDSQIELALRSMSTESRTQISGLAKRDRKFRDVVSRPSLLYIVSILWESELAKEHNIDSAFVMDRFIRHIYRRQVAKAADDRQFMALTLSEREYFLNGVAAYMVAKKTHNQIVVDQFREVVTKLYANVPETLYQKRDAFERAPMRPLAERMRDRPNPVEDIETDVRTYGILVRDYSRPGALRFPHKSFFELMFAQYVAKQLISEDKEETSAIAAATEVNLEAIVRMPESLAFVGEILGRKGRADLDQKGRIGDLFNLIVFGGRVRIPNAITRLMLMEAWWGQSLLMRLITPSMWLLFATALYWVSTVTLQQINPGEESVVESFRSVIFTLGFFMFVSICALVMGLQRFTVAIDDRLTLWYLVVSNLGFRGDHLATVFGRHNAKRLEKRFASRLSRFTAGAP